MKENKQSLKGNKYAFLEITLQIAILICGMKQVFGQ